MIIAFEYLKNLRQRIREVREKKKRMEMLEKLKCRGMLYLKRRQNAHIQTVSAVIQYSEKTYVKLTVPS